MKKFFSLIAAVLFAGSMMAGKYVKVTSAPADWAGQYLIVYEGDNTHDAVAFNGGLTSLDATGNGLAVTIVDNEIAGSVNLTNAEFTIAAVEGGYSVKAANGKYIGATSYSNSLAVSDEAIVNSLDDLVPAVVTDGGTVTMKYNYAANQLRFRYYKTGQQNVALYKLEGGDEPEQLADGYYLVGTMNDWTPAAAYKFEANTQAEGVEYMLEFTFAANSSFKVRAVVDGAPADWYPDGGDDKNCTINEAGDYTVYFRPNYDGGEGWFEACIFNQKKEAPVVTPISLTQFLADKPTTEVTLKDLTVIFATNKSTYVIDEDGVALVMYDANKTYYDGTLTAGKVLSGQKATYYVNKNQDEIIPTNAVEATDGVAPVPTLLTEKPTDANINRFISYKNVEATANNNKYYIFEDVQLYGATSDLKPSAAGNYDVEGIYIVYNGTAPEIIVTGLAESSPAAISNTDAAAKAVKFFENGQLIILKNGVKYNAQGAVVR